MLISHSERAARNTDRQNQAPTSSVGYMGLKDAGVNIAGSVAISAVQAWLRCPINHRWQAAC